MDYKEAKQIIQTLKDRGNNSDAHLAFLISILAGKLEIWCPNEYENFKQIFLREALKIEV